MMEIHEGEKVLAAVRIEHVLHAIENDNQGASGDDA
jgi:hypothetical protein